MDGRRDDPFSPRYVHNSLRKNSVIILTNVIK